MDTSDKRTAVIQATIELVAEYGFHGSPMSQIARQAGVAAGTIYHYFDSKDELIVAAYTHLEAQLLEIIMHGDTVQLPVRERFLHIGRTLLGIFAESPVTFRYVEQFYNSPYSIAYRRERLLSQKNDLVVSLFEAGILQQVVKVLPLTILLGLAFAPLMTISRDAIAGLVELDEPLMLKIVEACWDAVKR